MANFSEDKNGVHAGQPNMASNYPQLGISYANPAARSQTVAVGHPVTAAPPQQQPPQYYTQPNPYTAGITPPNAIYGAPPPGVGLQETFFGDTPAPFECPHCGKPGITSVKYV